MAVTTHSAPSNHQWLIKAGTWLQFLSNIYLHVGGSPKVEVPLKVFHLLNFQELCWVVKPSVSIQFLL